MIDTIQERLRRQGDSKGARIDLAQPLLEYEAADEIDRLERELAEAKGNAQFQKDRTVSLESELAEKDKRIEKLVSKRDSLVRFDAMKETLLRQANARIAELERTQAEARRLAADLCADKVHCFTTDQINAAWERVREAADLRRGEVVDELLAMLKIFGIVACPKCGGTKWIYVAAKRKIPCDCPHNGWGGSDD